MDYKEKQQHYRKLYKERGKVLYTSGKTYGIYNQVIKKGVPYTKEKKEDDK